MQRARSIALSAALAALAAGQSPTGAGKLAEHRVIGTMTYGTYAYCRLTVSFLDANGKPSAVDSVDLHAGTYDNPTGSATLVMRLRTGMYEAYLGRRWFYASGTEEWRVGRTDPFLATVPGSHEVLC